MAETGTIASFGASTEFHTVHTESQDSFFLQSDSTCCSYQSTISLYDIRKTHTKCYFFENPTVLLTKILYLSELGKLNFTDAFKLAITELPEEYNPISLGAYTTFVGEYGTHYTKRSNMGARYGIFLKVFQNHFKINYLVHSKSKGFLVTNKIFYCQHCYRHLKVMPSLKSVPIISLISPLQNSFWRRKLDVFMFAKYSGA